MSDASLLIFGCAVTFTAAAGAYIAARASYDRHFERRVEHEPVRLKPARPRTARRRDRAA